MSGNFRLEISRDFILFFKTWYQYLVGISDSCTQPPTQFNKTKMTLTSIENLPISLSDRKENEPTNGAKQVKSGKKDITQSEMAVDFSQEPLLKDNPNRFVILPIQYDDIWAMYKKAQASFWTAEEVDLEKVRITVKMLSSCNHLVLGSEGLE